MYCPDRCPFNTGHLQLLGVLFADHMTMSFQGSSTSNSILAFYLAPPWDKSDRHLTPLPSFHGCWSQEHSRVNILPTEHHSGPTSQDHHVMTLFLEWRNRSEERFTHLNELDNLSCSRVHTLSNTPCFIQLCVFCTFIQLKSQNKYLPESQFDWSTRNLKHYF